MGWRRWTNDPRVAVSCGANGNPTPTVQIHRHPARFAEPRTVELQPARRAGGRQVAVAHHDVRPRAQRDQCCPRQPHLAVGSDNQPVSPLPAHQHRAEIAAAPGIGRFGDCRKRPILRAIVWPRVPLSRRFRQHIAHIVPRPTAQHRHRPISLPHGHVPPVTGDQQIGRGSQSHHRATCSQHRQPQQPRARLPQDAPQAAEYNHGERNRAKMRQGPLRGG